jgi:hypothetical protein
MRECCGMIISVTCEHNDTFIYHVIWDGRCGGGLSAFPPTRGHEEQLNILCRTFLAHNIVIESKQKTIEKLEDVLCAYFDEGLIAGQLKCFLEDPPLPRNLKRENCDYLKYLKD